MRHDAVRLLACACAFLLLGIGAAAIPPPSGWTVGNAVASDRSYGSPFTVVDHIGPYTPFAARLVARGILRVTSAARRRHADFVPTAYGRRAIAEQGWVLDDRDLMIGSGSIELVPGSLRMVQTGPTARVSYRWRFVPSRALLDVVPSHAWPRELAPACVSAPGAASKSFARTIVLTHEGDGAWHAGATNWSPQTSCERAGAPVARVRTVVVPQSAVETGADAAIDTYLAGKTSDAWLLLDGERQNRLSGLLERDGIVRAQFSYQTCFGPHTRFAMTDHGERVATRRDWLAVGWGLFFSTGRYEELRNERRVIRAATTGYAVRFVYRFVPNVNAELVPWLVPSTAPQSATLLFGGRNTTVSVYRATGTC